MTDGLPRAAQRLTRPVPTLLALASLAHCAPPPPERGDQDGGPPFNVTGLVVELNHSSQPTHFRLRARRAGWNAAEPSAGLQLEEVHLALPQGLAVEAQAQQAWWSPHGGVTLRHVELRPRAGAGLVLTAERLEVSPAGGWRGEQVQARFRPGLAGPRRQR